MASNQGTLFWIAFPGNLEPGAALYILAEFTTDFTVAVPGQNFSVTGTAGPGAPGIVQLPEAVAAVQTNETVEAKGIRVTASRPVTVILRSPLSPGQSDEAYLALPVALLGTDYYVTLGYEESVSARGFPGNTEPSQLTIVAAESGTNVTVIPSCLSLSGSDPGVPVNITLNAGEVWQYRCGFRGDVTGTRVTSSRPIAVFGGSRCSDVPPGVGFCDYLVEQLIPVRMWGTVHLVPPIQNGAANLVRVLAAEDNTWVYFDNGTGTTAVELNAGEFSEGFYDVPLMITSSRPVLVGQYGVGAAQNPFNPERDPFFVQVFSTRLFTPEHRFYSPPGYENFVNIVAPIDAEVVLDGSPVTGFTPMPGGSYKWATSQVSTGEHVMTGTEPIMGYAYGLRTDAAYGYPTGLAFSPLDPADIWLISAVLLSIVILAVVSA
ncbi:MAG: hypothetical protein GX195_08785 [Firmicutes bacterium]|nr:hypothetical protein [Bacillota bacterium]